MIAWHICRFNAPELAKVKNGNNTHLLLFRKFVISGNKWRFDEW